MAAPVMNLKRAKADTSASQLYYTEELGSWAQTPLPASVLHEVRYTGESLQHNKNTVQSQEIRSDAQITDLIEVGVAGEGDINIELSYGAHDDFLAALLRTTWVDYVSTLPVTGFVVTGVAPNQVFTITSTNFGTAPELAKLTAGTVIRVNGSANNDGFYTLKLNATSTLITVVDGLTAEASPPGTTKIDSSSIRNGKAKRSFLLERQFTDLMPANYTPPSGDPPIEAVHVMKGARMNTLTLNFTADSILTGTFGIMGDQMTVQAATSGTFTATPSPAGSLAPTFDVMNATSNVGAVYFNGAILNNAIQSVTLEVTNNCRAQRAIASRSAVGIGYGRFVVTGTMNMYFEDSVMFKHMINHDAVSWSAVVSDTPSDPSAGRSYAFNVFRLKFGTGGPEAGAPDTDVMQSIAYTAMRDPTTKVTLQICRFGTPT